MLSVPYVHYDVPKAPGCIRAHKRPGRARDVGLVKDAFGVVVRTWYPADRSSSYRGSESFEVAWGVAIA